MLSDQQLDELATKGYLFADNIVPSELWKNLQKELQHLVEQNQLTPAGIGKTATRKTEMRSDVIQWISPDTPSPAERVWLDFIDELRQELNQTLYLGAQDYEGHLAQYPAGSFYKAHLDQHKGQSSRLMTVILYLNPSWKDGDGGELKFYPEIEKGTEGASFKVQPLAGRIAIFQSDNFWHEVLPSNTSRLSLTGWLRRLS